MNSESGVKPFEEKSFLNQTALIQALTWEIDIIEKEQNRPGWTKWALLGSSAMVISFGLNELVGKQYVGAHIAIVFVSTFLLERSFLAIKMILDRLEPYQPNGVRFTFSRNFASSRILLLLWSVLFATVFWLSYIIQPMVSFITVISLRMFLALSLFNFVVVLIILFVDLPVSKSTSRKWVISVVSLIDFGLSSMAAFGCVQSIYSTASAYSLPEFRLGLLCFAFVSLVLLLTNDPPMRPLMRTLVELRRDLAFGRIDIAAANRQAEIAIAGLKTADVLQPHLEKVLKICEKLQRSLQKAHSRLNILESTMKTERINGIDSNDPVSLIHALIDSFDVSLDGVLILVRESKKINAAFERRATYLVSMNPDSKSDVEDLKAKIGAELDKAISESGALKNHYQTFKQQFKNK